MNLCQRNWNGIIQTLLLFQGQLIVSKVFLGRSFPIHEGDSVDALNYPKAHSVYRNVSPEQVHKTNGGNVMWNITTVTFQNNQFFYWWQWNGNNQQKSTFFYSILLLTNLRLLSK